MRAGRQFPAVALFAFVAALFAAKSLAAGVPSTPMEAAIDQLRARFPNQIVVGFEELWDTRPETEPHIDLGPPNSTLQDVLARIRRDNPQYKVDLLPGNLVHIYPALGTSDPAGLLNIRLKEFFLPPDQCIEQQFRHVDTLAAMYSYTPELSHYLAQHNEKWRSANGKIPGGVIGEFMGDCEPKSHRHEPIYQNITVREALNLMAVRSLQVANKQVPSTAPSYFMMKPISWRYRLRREPNADTGLGGVPVFQTF